MSRLKILWLCSWYPRSADPFNGDFIQRHAQAASILHDIHVIHVTTVDENTAAVEKSRSPGLSEEIFTYCRGRSFAGRIKGIRQLLNIYKTAAEDYIKTNGTPDIIHVHVPVWAGLSAVRLKSKYKVPVIVTEHWGIYNDIVDDNFLSRPWYFRWLTKKIFRSASLLLSVSKFLAMAIQKQVTAIPYEIIPNVVNTSLFHPGDKESDCFRFIHVSNMVPLKNSEGILRAFAALCRLMPRVQLVMVGNPDCQVVEYSKTLQIPAESVSFKGIVPYAAVATEMKRADCLLLFSNIENSPCVIGEALCCGIPVIATRTGGIPELIDDTNGIMVECGDENGLVQAMRHVIDKYGSFNKQVITEKASATYSYETIASKFSDIYVRFGEK
jgi:glycosyltransferase involved in cell wall biosynthesis